MEQHDCETCAELGMPGKPANRMLDGVWVCVECIVSINSQEIREDNKRKDVEFSAREKAKMQPTIQAPASKPQTAIVLSPVENAKTLLGVLSQTMDGLLNGSVKPDAAMAICKVSSEAVKAMDLMWRIQRGQG